MVDAHPGIAVLSLTKQVAGTTSFATAMFQSWNGPVCGTRGRGYMGSHTCSPTVLRRRIADLQALVQRIEEESRSRN